MHVTLLIDKDTSLLIRGSAILSFTGMLSCCQELLHRRGALCCRINLGVIARSGFS